MRASKMDSKWTSKGGNNLEKKQFGPFGPPMVAQWMPKTSKIAYKRPPKFPKWTPELPKWSSGAPKTHKMEHQAAKIKL